MEENIVSLPLLKKCPSASPRPSRKFTRNEPRINVWDGRRNEGTEEEIDCDDGQSRGGQRGRGEES